MKYEYAIKGELNTIQIWNSGNRQIRFSLRSQYSKFEFEEVEISLSVEDVELLKQAIKNRKVGKEKIGKFSGFYRQCLSIERETTNSPITIVISKWFTIFGGCFGIQLYRENCEEFLSALESDKF